VSGKRITDQQIRLYMKYRDGSTQAAAAAKAGISERSARRIAPDNYNLALGHARGALVRTR